MKKIILLALSAGLVLQAFVPLAAEAKDGEPGLVSPATLYPNSVGFAGNSLGYGGLSWQRWFDKFGAAVTFGGSSLPAGYSYYGSTLVEGVQTNGAVAWSYNVELDLMLKLFSSTFAQWIAGDLFGYLSLAHSGGQNVTLHNNDTVDVYNDDWYTQNEYEWVANIGLGIGYEITLFKHFSVPLQFGYMVQLPPGADFAIGPVFTGGLRYRY